MSSSGRRGLFVVGIGIGLMLVPVVRKRVLNVIEDSSPEIYRLLSEAKDQVKSAVEAGLEAARQYDKESAHSDKLVNFESEDESPNFIV